VSVPYPQDSRADTSSEEVLRDRRALITGAGRGIGRAIALAFASQGARVAAAARTIAEIEEVAAACGPQSVAISLDVRSEAACIAAVEECRKAFGSLDILVNAAGIASSQKFTDLTPETWRDIIATDLDGPMSLTRAVLPLMLEIGAGRVISIASTAALTGGRYIAAYSAAKHGLLGLTRALAAEYAPTGITFNCVCPGYVDTDMTARTIANIVSRTGRTAEQARAILLTPQGRLIDPEEVAQLAVFLASDAGRSINGQALAIDGGANAT
jgi:NAD(P)-dependent dehydrogenase (short-subunit alcohol dehydrogenase family)